MRSSDRRRRAIACALIASSAFFAASRARAQRTADGFGVERLVTSAPGAGWFVMDTLDMHGRLGGAMSLTTSYARNPLRLGDDTTRAAVVSSEASTEFGFSASFDRFRAYVGFAMPLAIHGDDATIHGVQFKAPSVDPGTNPDTLFDTRIGVVARLYGGPHHPFRLGVGAQLWFPNGVRSDYDTDGTYRGMARVLFAGDIGAFVYAGNIGVHVRPLNDDSTPGSPRGSEWLFGIAAGSKLPLCDALCATALVIGPEIFGATAIRSAFSTDTTAVEGLLSARVEGTREDGPQLRFKIGVGTGIHAHFGAPEGRIVFGIELFEQKSRP